MGIDETVGKYLFSVGAKRASAALIGYMVGLLGCPAFIHALTLLQVAGITVTVDQPVFEKWLAGAASVAIVMAHDYLKVRFESWKWL